MSHRLYVASVTKALRDRVLPKLEDSEARGVLEAAIRALAGVGDALDVERESPPLGAFPLAEIEVPGPPENSAVRKKTAATIAAAANALSTGAWLHSADGIREATAMVAWERDRMSEAVEAMRAGERTVITGVQQGPDPLLIPLDAVEKFFKKHWGPESKVISLRQATGGRSRQTALLTVEDGAGRRRELVIQRDHPAGISPRGVVTEYPVLQLIAGTKVKAPRPVLLERSRDVLGAPFIVAERITGQVAGPDYFRPPKDQNLARQLGQQLAFLHAVNPTGLHDMPQKVSDWTLELDELEATWERLKHWPSITATAAFGWMREHVAEIGDEESIVHNDAAFHNILVENGEITALLDWELVHIGHPAEDLGYCRPFIEEMGAWNDFLDAYTAAGGRRFSPAVINYFSLRGLLYLTTLFQKGGRLMFETRVTDDINLAEVGASFMPKVMLRLANILATVLEDG